MNLNLHLGLSEDLANNPYSNLKTVISSDTKATPMSVAEETEAAVSAITADNESTAAANTSPRITVRRASSGGAVSLYSSDDDVSDRLVINEDECEDFNPTIAERLRQTRKTSTETQPISRGRPSREYVRGLIGDDLYKCGVAGK